MTKQLDARQIIAYNKKSIKKMKNIIGDAESSLSLTATQVPIFFLIFILMVFGCHIIFKLIPSISPIQLFIAVVVITTSIWFSIWFKE